MEFTLGTPQPTAPQEGKKFSTKTLVVFDFDETLISGDSLWLMIKRLCGVFFASVTFMAAMGMAVFTTAHYKGDYKTAIKAAWLRMVLRGRTITEVQAVADAVEHELNWKIKQRALLEEYARGGATVLVATGALDVYIYQLLSRLPRVAVQATPMEVVGDRLTGYMRGRNNVRAEKARRVQDYIKQYGPYGKIIGYGNLPSDKAMLALCDEQHVV